ncbi:hypothetical protein GCM10023205_27600 [Yinghuangia aomiensis]|uniref:WD-40 repeat-containing protein n=1 Tax=Yinghuangia aomiensis TaxID=676205 RepID=A0ABP9H6N5_9ACTN
MFRTKLPGSGLCSVAVTESDGRPVLLTGAFEGVTMWDVSDGQLAGRRLHGDLGEVRVVSFAVVDDRLVVVTAMDEDAVVWGDEGEPVDDPRFDVWDAVTAEHLCSFERPDGEPFGYPAHAACVEGEFGDPRVAVVLAEREGPFHVWDLENYHELRAEGQRHVPAVACARVHGVPVAVTAGDDGLMRMWSTELFADGEIGDPWPCGALGQVNALAVGHVDGRAVLVAGGDQVGLWDLATRTSIGQPTALHDTYVTAVGTGRLRGRPVAVSGDFHGTIRVWDLSTGEPWGEPMSSGRWKVDAVAAADAGGRALVASASLHGIVSAWELPAA